MVTMGLAVDFGFAILHEKRSPSGMGLFSENTLYYECRPLLRFSGHEIRLFIPSLDITVVTSSATQQTRCNPVFYAIS
jgi:hypothetical protein